MKTLMFLLVTLQALSPTLNAPLTDSDVVAEQEPPDDGVHNHEDPVREGKWTFNYNPGYISVHSATGDRISIGHNADIVIAESSTLSSSQSVDPAPRLSVCAGGEISSAACFCKAGNGDDGEMCKAHQKCGTDGTCADSVEEERIVPPCTFDDSLLDTRTHPGQGAQSPVETNIAFKWPKNKVPFYYSNENTKVEDKTFIRGVMNIIQDKTCFTFVEKTDEEHSLEIFINNGNECKYSAGSVIIVDIRLKLTLTNHVTKSDGTNCGKTGLIIHELMHVLGVGHTQRRSDRNSYITVEFDALANQQARNQYDICDQCILIPGIPYKCGSIMHYGKYDNAKNYNNPVIVPINENICQLDNLAWWSKNMDDESKILVEDWDLLNKICEDVCSINPSNRVKCGRQGIHRSDCESIGCCFDPIEDSPWCFRKPAEKKRKRSVHEVATVRGKVVLPADSDFTFPEDSRVHISCYDISNLLGSVEVDVSNKSSKERIHYELEADLSNSGDISMSATINVGWNRDLNGDEWIRKGDFTNDVSHPIYVTGDTSNYQMDIMVAFYNY